MTLTPEMIERARIEGFNEGIEAAVAAVDEGIDCNGIIASDIASLAKRPTDEAGEAQ